MLRRCCSTSTLCGLHDRSIMVGVMYKCTITTATTTTFGRSYCCTTTSNMIIRRKNWIPKTIRLLQHNSTRPLSNNNRIRMMKMSMTANTTTATATASTNEESLLLKVPPFFANETQEEDEIIKTKVNDFEKVRIDKNEHIMHTNTTSSNTNTNDNSVPFYGLPRHQEAEEDNKIITITNSTLLQRIQYLVTNCTIAYNDPKRADAVGNIGEVTGSVALYQLLQSMEQNTVGQILLHDRPIVTKDTIDYTKLIDSVSNLSITNFNDIIHNTNNILDTITFGQAYGMFLQSHNFDPNERSSVQYLNSNDNSDNNSTNDIAYVMTRYRQCHDYYHVITGLPPSILGELVLKGFELYQTLLPLTVLSTIIGPQQLSTIDQHLFYTIYQPWYIHAGQSIPYGTILNIYYEKHFNTSLQQLRQQYNIIPAPPIPSLPPSSSSS